MRLCSNVNLNIYSFYIGLRSKHHHGHGKTSVMERVTNALCGGSSHNNASIGAPEKPSRIASAKQMVTGKLITSSGSNSQQGTPQSIRKLQAAGGQNVNQMGGSGGGGVNIGADCNTGTQKKFNTDLSNWNWIAKSNISTMEQLLQDERFLNKFFQYFTPYERRTLAQVCTRWRDTLYRSPKFWSGILPTLQCRELRQMSNQDRVKLYNSLVRRGFHAVCLLGATDEDAIDIVHSFPLASKHIHSLSLRCASISDRGLEALLDHLQVSLSIYIYKYRYIMIVNICWLLSVFFFFFIAIQRDCVKDLLLFIHPHRKTSRTHVVIESNHSVTLNFKINLLPVNLCRCVDFLIIFKRNVRKK